MSIVETVETRRDATVRSGVIGTSAPRPDGIAKVQGWFAFSSDLSAEGCLWGATLRSPHPYARIVRIDPGPAWRINGVEAVITADDV
ncbi:MAG TPA: xanthine dehydrogenase subunit D, partial [Ilumatobacteraceae bacterium]|nr:xanthine dehydrogenase subunit D [Ilumatobacteraceae bacterium]